MLALSILLVYGKYPMFGGGNGGMKIPSGSGGMAILFMYGFAYGFKYGG
jgi:hypothetical protein